MRRRWIVVFAVLASVLMMSAAPVAAQNASAVASKNTTASDFEDGTLDNLVVEGSGDDAAVVLDTQNETVDDYSDGDLSEYQGDLGDAEIVSSRLDSTSLHIDNYGKIISTSGLLAYPEPGDSFTTIVTDHDDGGDSQSVNAGILFAVQGSGSFYRVRVDNRGSETGLNLKKAVDGSVTTLDSANPGISDSIEYRINVDWGTNGEITVTVLNDATGDTIATLSATDTTYQSGGVGMVGKEGLIGDIKITKTSVDHATYIGAHDAEKIEQGWTDLTLQNASATVTWQADSEDGTWTNVTSTTVTSTTNVTQNLSGTTSDRWRVRVDIEATGSDPVAEIHDEGLLFDSEAPAADIAAATPTGKTSSSTVNISVPVSDADFATAQGDSVEAKIQTRPSGGSFSTVGTQTISSNQTVSTTFTPEQGGEYEYRVVLTDSYGSNTTSSTRTFSTPAQLTFYRESENSTIISSANVTIRFYPVGDSTGQVVTKTTSNGTINMTGLPVNQPFVAVANASGYESRRIFIRSLYEQQRMFLLNSSVESAETIFQLRDYTGRFPPGETVLEIRRSINGSWRTVSGDYFGAASEYPSTLEIGARYRLRLHNPETGATRPLGTYQPLVAQTQTLAVSPQSGITDLDTIPSATIRPQTRRVPALNDSQISVSLSSVENTTVESWRLLITQNTTTIINTTYDGDTRETTVTADLGAAAGEQILIEVEATLADGRTIPVGAATLSVYESPTNNLALLALIVEFVGLAAPGTEGALTSFLATISTVFVMAGVSTQLPVSGETTALTGVLTLTGFAVVGWVGYGVVFISGSAVVAFAALRRGI